MRIAMLGPTYPFRGGIAHYTTLLARHLGARHEVVLLSYAAQYPPTLYPGRTDRDPSRLALDGSAERVLAPLRPWTWWRTGRRLAALAPHLVIVQWWVPFWAPSVSAVMYLASRWTDARRIFICHNVLPHERVRRVDRWLVQLALRRGQEFIVHSADDARSLRDLLPAPTGDGRNVHRSVLPLHTIGAPADRRCARRRLALPDEAHVALFFGFVRPYKGLAYLIDALPLVTHAVPDARLLIAGEFWEPVEPYRQRIAANGVADRVLVFDRYVPNEEVGELFAAADVVVLPYTDASQSGVVTLAAQYARPVIATRAGGLPESVVDGETGLIVPAGDAASLAEALIRLYTEPELAAALDRGVVAGRDRFSWDRLVALIEALAGSAAGAAPQR